MKRTTMKKIIVKLKALLLNRPTRVKTNVNISYENIAEGEMDNGVIIMERLPLVGGYHYLLRRHWRSNKFRIGFVG